MNVQCSAKIVAGTDRVGPARETVLAVIDRNGHTCAEIDRIIGDLYASGFGATPCGGVYDGQTQRSALVALRAEHVGAAHYRLSDLLPGFKCFAILTLP